MRDFIEHLQALARRAGRKGFAQTQQALTQLSARLELSPFANSTLNEEQRVYAYGVYKYIGNEMKKAHPMSDQALKTAVNDFANELQNTFLYSFRVGNNFQHIQQDNTKKDFIERQIALLRRIARQEEQLSLEMLRRINQEYAQLLNIQPQNPAQKQQLNVNRAAPSNPRPQQKTAFGTEFFNGIAGLLTHWDKKDGPEFKGALMSFFGTIMKMVAISWGGLAKVLVGRNQVSEEAIENLGQAVSVATTNYLVKTQAKYEKKQAKAEAKRQAKAEAANDPAAPAPAFVPGFQGKGKGKGRAPVPNPPANREEGIRFRN